VLSRIVRALKPGITELMVHPGYVDDALTRSHTRLLASRAAEVRLLCAPETKALVRDEHVDLVRHDLLPHQPFSPRVVSAQRSLRHVS
jgi:predicted glycoside hydrolase/deacetylase ChbG (UPF0249 family)